MRDNSLIRLPQLGLTMTEGTLMEWRCRPGDEVRAGDILYVVETDKIANEIEADRNGVIAAILVDVEQTVAVGTTLAQWEGGGSDEIPDAVPAPPAKQSVTQASPRTVPRPDGKRVIATPLARRRARERGVQLESLSGSGPGGRIVARDVPAAAAVPAARTVGDSAAALRPLVGVERAIAERMTQSQRDIPHFYLTAHAEISELQWLHESLKKKPDLDCVTLTHWIATAVGLVIAATPKFRTVYVDGGHVILPGSDVGIAVAANDTLYAPVARGVGTQPLAENAITISALVAAAQAGRLTAEALNGAATTISNLGAFSIEQVFPLIIPGQSSIVGVGREQAVFRPGADGAPELRRELSLVLACDHRVFNGTDGAAMLCAITELLEDPLRIIAQPRTRQE